MGLVRVYNDNKHPFKEQLGDDTIAIDPGEYVVMEESEAIRLRGQFKPVVMTAQKQPDPKHFKMLRIAPHQVEAEVAAKPKFVCQFDGKEFDTQKELDEYIDANHLDKLSDQDYAKKRREKKAN